MGLNASDEASLPARYFRVAADGLRNQCELQQNCFTRLLVWTLLPGTTINLEQVARGRCTFATLTYSTMEEYSTGAVVSFDSNELRDSEMTEYDFNDILPLTVGGMEVESEYVEEKLDQYLDPSTNDSLVSLNWDSATPSSRFPDCFLDFDSEDFFVNDDSPEPTEVSEDEMDQDSSDSLEHRFEETARRLAESMEKSRKTRFSLSLKSPTFEKYPRRESISDVVTSVQESSHQILTTFQIREPSPRPIL